MIATSLDALEGFGPSPSSVSPDLLALTSPFPAADSSLLLQRTLLRRIDTKFVVPVDELETILGGLEQSYAKVLAAGSPWEGYDTLYFDTPEELCFHDHRRGRLGRSKLRIRHYLDRRLTYFEVKLKSNHRLTTKLRRRKDFGHETLTSDDQALAAQAPRVPATRIVPRLRTAFSRLHLVGLEHEERVTIDVNVRFQHGRRERAAALDELAASTIGRHRLVRDLTPRRRPLAVVEVKQPSFRSRTPIMLALRSVSAKRRRASKYCLGVLLTSSAPRAHRFLPDVKQIARLQCSKS